MSWGDEFDPMSLVRGGICLVIAFSVLAFGAVEAWSAAVVEISAAVLLLVWAIAIARDRTATIQWNALNGPLLAFLAIGLLQLFLGGTAYAFLTRMEVLRVAAYVILFFWRRRRFGSGRTFPFWRGSWFFFASRCRCWGSSSISRPRGNSTGCPA